MGEARREDGSSESDGILMSIETKAKTFWFLDVDGVINAFPTHRNRSKYKQGKATPFYGSDPYSMGSYMYKINYDPTILERMRNLHESGQVEIVWLTTWGDGANGGLRRLVGLPELRVAGEMEDPKYRGLHWWKDQALKDWMENHPDAKFIWTDDHLSMYLTEEELEERLGTAGMAICTPEETGLTHEDIDRIEEFLQNIE